MIHLPLQSLLNIPPEGLTIVVDNARSPEESVSFRMHSRQQKRQRRTSPTDNHTECCRWSAIPPPPLVTSEDAMDPCSAGSFLRASAFHEMDSCSTPASNPLRAPVRQKSDNNLLVNERANTSPLPSLSKENIKKKSIAATRCSSLTLKIPVRKVSSDALVEQPTLRRSPSCSAYSQMNFQWDIAENEPPSRVRSCAC